MKSLFDQKQRHYGTELSLWNRTLIRITTFFQLNYNKLFVTEVFETIFPYLIKYFIFLEDRTNR